MEHAAPDSVSQSCLHDALPICVLTRRLAWSGGGLVTAMPMISKAATTGAYTMALLLLPVRCHRHSRSEERRVGKGCKTRRIPNLFTTDRSVSMCGHIE